MTNKKNITIGIPLYSSVKPECFINFAKLLTELDKDFETKIEIEQDKLPIRAKQKIIKKAIENKSDYLLYYDLNLIVTTKILQRLVERNEAVVSALYFNDLTALPNFQMKKEGKFSQVLGYPKNRLFEVDGIELGCTLIKKEVLKKIENDNFDLEYLDSTKIISEDLKLSEKIKERGYKIYVDTGAQVGRFGGLIGEAYYLLKYGRVINNLTQKIKENKQN